MKTWQKKSLRKWNSFPKKTMFRNERLIHSAFDEHGTVRICGRENCRKLIIFANEIVSAISLNVNVPHESFGNENTGVMNVEAIHTLYNRLKTMG